MFMGGPHSPVLGAWRSLACRQQRRTVGFRAPATSAVSSDPNMEGAEEVGGLGDHGLEVGEAPLAVAVQVTFLSDLVAHEQRLVVLQL